MEEDGTIRGYTIREGGIDSPRWSASRSPWALKIGSFAAEVTHWAGVEVVYEVSGDADLIALVHVADTMSLRQLRPDVDGSARRDRVHNDGTRA